MLKPGSVGAGERLQEKSRVVDVTGESSEANWRMCTALDAAPPGRTSMQTNYIRTASIAAAAAAFALSALPAFAADAPAGSKGRALSAEDPVHCYGVNDCKGTADCATSLHECKGQNGCKGQGFKALKAGECLTKGGTIGDLG